MQEDREGITFDKDYTLPLEVRGFLSALKHLIKSRVFSVKELRFICPEFTEYLAKKLIAKAIGYGYVRRAKDSEDWVERGVIFQPTKKPKYLYKWFNTAEEAYDYNHKTEQE